MLTSTPRLDALPDFLSVEECAAVLRIGRNTAYDRAKDGSIPSVRLGRRIVIPKTAIERLMAGCDAR